MGEAYACHGERDCNGIHRSWSEPVDVEGLDKATNIIELDEAYSRCMLGHRGELNLVLSGSRGVAETSPILCSLFLSSLPAATFNRAGSLSRLRILLCLL